MKLTLIILFLFISFQTAFCQDSKVNLNGKTFRGTATETTDDNKVVIEDHIKFLNGKLISAVLSLYSAGECFYTAKIDGRRMMAMDVINIEAETKGFSNGEKVNIKFSGSLIGGKKLTGNFFIKYPEKAATEYLVEAGE